MPRLFDGVIMTTGYRDTGKTTFAITCGEQPEHIAFFDHDIKSGVIVHQIEETGHKFGAYYNLVKIKEGKTEIQFHDFCVGLIRDLPSNIKCIVWDNFTPFEDTMYPKAMQNPTMYRQTWSTMGAIKGSQQWDCSFILTEQILNLMLEKAPLVHIIYHLKNLNLGGVRTEKMVPAAKRVIPTKANLSLWLMMNPTGAGAPIGLVLKRFGKMLVTDKGLEAVNVLPRRLNPCTWDKIREYWTTPVGDRVLTQDEKPNAFELSILDGNLTPEQRKSFELILQYGKVEEDDGALAEMAEVGERVRNYAKDNPASTPIQIKEALGLEMPIPEILKFLG